MFKICIIGKFLGYKDMKRHEFQQPVVQVFSFVIYKDAINIFVIKNDKIQCIYTAILQNRARKLTIFFFFQILETTNKIYNSTFRQHFHQHFQISDFFIIFQNGSIRMHLGQKQQINNTINSNPSTSSKSEAARVRKRYI